MDRSADEEELGGRNRNSSLQNNFVVMSAAAPASSSASVLNSNEPTLRPAITRSQSYAPNGIPAPPIAAPQIRASETKDAPDAVLELIDGTAFCGISFGAQRKSVAGECVFQTGARMAPTHLRLCCPQE